MMKKIFSLGLMLAALTLTNCSKDAVEEHVMPAGSADFEIFASTDEGRTANEGLKTVWKGGDQVNLFHSNSDGTYFSNGSFTIAEEDVATNRFTGKTAYELGADSLYNWYMIYPYKSFIKDPANEEDPENNIGGYFYIGSRSDSSQHQTEPDNMKHIAGTDVPLYGFVADVLGSEKPMLTMKHVTSVVEFNISNPTANDLTVTEIALTAPEAICGSFYPHFTADGQFSMTNHPTYTASTARLSITDGVVLAGESATFYMVVKPFALAADKELTIKVTADAGVCTKTITGKATTFTAGKIKTLNFAFDAPEEVETIADGDYVIVAEATNGYCAMSVQADGDRRAYTLLNDWNAESATYTTSDADLVWQIKAVNGGYTISNNGQYISWVSGNKAPLSSTAYTVAIAPQADGTNYITTSGGIRILAKNADAQYGFGFYETATTNGIKNLYLKPVNFVKLPDLAWGEESTAITYDDVAAHTVTVTTDATSVSVAAYDDEAYSIASTWLTTSYKDGVLTYQATNQNESADPRSAYVVATTSNENGSKVYTLVITQAGKPATGGTETTVTYDFTKIEGFSTWTTSYGQHVVTYDEATVDFTKHNRQTGTITDCPVGKGAPVTIVMTNQSTIKSVKFVCKNWTTKAQTITLHYSINGGTSYSTTGITSTNFEIESTELPAGTNAVKITFSSTNNQVGIASATLTYVK